MIKLLVKLFIKDYDNVKDKTVREKYGVLGGVLGVICNIILFAIKLVIGILSSSLAIMSDAFNNLSDTFSSIVSIISAKFANKKPDKDHPYGHGRIEYICSMIVAFLILIVGVELLISSGKEIIEAIKGNPISVEFDLVLMIILGLSLLIKLWMFSYNRYLGKKINSSVLLAASSDSISDVLTSFVVILSTILGYFLFPNIISYIDGGMGLIVAIIISINGLKLVFETIDVLLGKPASEEEVKAIEDFVMQDPHILGTHDLRLHDYGPGRKFASVHCEVDDQSDINEAHEIIDSIENKAENVLGIELVIHMDPISTISNEVNEVRKVVGDVIKELDPELSFHDLRITNGKENINVIFDLVIPFSYSKEELEKTISFIRKEVKRINNKYTCVIKIDYKY